MEISAGYARCNQARNVSISRCEQTIFLKHPSRCSARSLRFRARSRRRHSSFRCLWPQLPAGKRRVHGTAFASVFVLFGVSAAIAINVGYQERIYCAEVGVRLGSREDYVPFKRKGRTASG